MDNPLHEYRNALIEIEGKAQEDFDKTVLSLSGGALGISFAFVNNIVGANPLHYSGCLFAAWIVWGISVTCVLASYYFSQQALRRAIKQVDTEKIYTQQAGGAFSTVTAILNAAGGVLFLAGVVLIVVFASFNLR